MLHANSSVYMHKSLLKKSSILVGSRKFMIARWKSFGFFSLWKVSDEENCQNSRIASQPSTNYLEDKWSWKFSQPFLFRLDFQAKALTYSECFLRGSIFHDTLNILGWIIQSSIIVIDTSFGNPNEFWICFLLSSASRKKNAHTVISWCEIDNDSTWAFLERY